MIARAEATLIVACMLCPVWAEQLAQDSTSPVVTRCISLSISLSVLLFMEQSHHDWLLVELLSCSSELCEMYENFHTRQAVVL